MPPCPQYGHVTSISLSLCYLIAKINAIIRCTVSSCVSVSVVGPSDLLHEVASPLSTTPCQSLASEYLDLHVEHHFLMKQCIETSSVLVSGASRSPPYELYNLEGDIQVCLIIIGKRLHCWSRLWKQAQDELMGSMCCVVLLLSNVAVVFCHHLDYTLRIMVSNFRSPIFDWTRIIYLNVIVNNCFMCVTNNKKITNKDMTWERCRWCMFQLYMSTIPFDILSFFSGQAKPRTYSSFSPSSVGF